MRAIGFSTGAIALDDFRQALKDLSAHSTHAIEVSALRLKELLPLISSIPDLDLSQFTYISLHLPSAFSEEEEAELIANLKDVPFTWTLVVHPDSIHNYDLWRPLGRRVAIENMDRRKSCGRTAEELRKCFELLPEARFCLDVGHARQFDPSMAEAYNLLKAFSNRLVQLHVSEVDSQSRHAVITYAAELAFREVSHMIPEGIPLILESRVNADGIERELHKASQLFSVKPHPNTPGSSTAHLARDRTAPLTQP